MKKISCKISMNKTLNCGEKTIHRKNIKLIIIIISVFFTCTAGNAELITISNDIFFDDINQLYWWDNPAFFNSYDRNTQQTAIDTHYVTVNGYFFDDWRFATQREVALLTHDHPMTNWLDYFDGEWIKLEGTGQDSLWARSESSDIYSGSDVILVNPPRGAYKIYGDSDTLPEDDYGAWVVTDHYNPVPVFAPVNIDIKPDSTTNCININDHGVIPVAIMGAADFDVTQVDPATCSLQGMKVKMVGKSNKLLFDYTDVNSDGYVDLLLKIDDLDGDFVEGQTEATLTGALYDGTQIEGSDFICIK